MTPNEMLQMLSTIWAACAEYPDAEHGEILGHIEKLQSLVFQLRGGENG